MYKLCVAEKPGVGKDIARVLGATKNENGYCIGNGYIVTWCVGHLVGLAEPDDYKTEWKQENFDKSNLPIVPEKWKLVILEKTKKQFQIVKDLMNRDDVELIIDCGDMGDQGHYLQWLVREKARCKKPVKRFCATSLTDDAINYAINNLREIGEFRNIIKSEFCKAKGDFLIGINMSRLYKQPRFVTPVGRVLTPTLGFVVDRYLEVENFVSTPYYELYCEICGDGDSVRVVYFDEDGRKITDKEKIEMLALEIKKYSFGEVTLFEKKKSEENPPKLYDILELERDGNRIYGYETIKVLSIAQSLYEKHKLITYPRTDSPYLTKYLVPEVKKRIVEIIEKESYPMNSSDFDNFTNRIVCDEKVTDHHAIILTEKYKSFDFSQLTIEENNILKLIVDRMLISLSEKAVYEKINVEVLIGDKFLFKREDKVLQHSGYLKVQNFLLGKSGEEKEICSLQFELNERVNIKDVLIENRMTSSPKLHTEDTLLYAMKHASNVLENEEHKEILNGHGIGTQSTRAGIISKLFDYKYVKTTGSGKTKFLVPTKKGISLINAVAPELSSPIITAEWELKMQQIKNGLLDDEVLYEEIKQFVVELVQRITQGGFPTIESDEEDSNKEVLGRCPLCGGNIYEGYYNDFYCENVKSKKCFFRIDKTKNYITVRTKKALTKRDLKNLIIPRGATLTCVNKEGVKFKANFKIKTDYPENATKLEYEMMFINTRKSIN